MPRTLDNHLVGVTADAPHPESYRADLPLSREEAPVTRDAIDAAYDDGYDDGKEYGLSVGYTKGERDTEARIRRQQGITGA